MGEDPSPLPVPKGRVQALVVLKGSVPDDDAGHAYLTYRSVWGLDPVPRTVTAARPMAPTFAIPQNVYPFSLRIRPESCRN